MWREAGSMRRSRCEIEAARRAVEGEDHPGSLERDDAPDVDAPGADGGPKRAAARGQQTPPPSVGSPWSRIHSTARRRAARPALDADEHAAVRVDGRLGDLRPTSCTRKGAEGSAASTGAAGCRTGAAARPRGARAASSDAGVPARAAQPGVPGPDRYQTSVPSGTTSARRASAARRGGRPRSTRAEAHCDAGDHRERARTRRAAAASRAARRCRCRARAAARPARTRRRASAGAPGAVARRARAGGSSPSARAEGRTRRARARARRAGRARGTG